MRNIGMTGGIGCGKSKVAEIFDSLGFYTIDSDITSRKVMEINGPAYNQIVSYFGKDILDEKEGALDNYLKLLQSGGSNYSTFLLKIVGIDIVNDDTIKNAIDLFDDVIDEFYKNL